MAPALAAVLVLFASSPAFVQRPVAELTTAPDAQTVDRATNPELGAPPRAPEEEARASERVTRSPGKDAPENQAPQPEDFAAEAPRRRAPDGERQRLGARAVRCVRVVRPIRAVRRTRAAPGTVAVRRTVSVGPGVGLRGCRRGGTRGVVCGGQSRPRAARRRLAGTELAAASPAAASPAPVEDEGSDPDDGPADFEVEVL